MKKYLFIVLLGAALSVPGFGQDNLNYQEPPKSIVDLVNAPESPEVMFNSEGNLMLILEVPGYASIEQVAQPIIGVAGLRINPSNNSTEAELAGVYSGIIVKDIKTGKENAINGLPKDMQMANIAWSPDGNKIAFSNKKLDGVELWIADIPSLQAKRLTNGFLNDAYGRVLQWHPDGSHILAQFIPSSRKMPPTKSNVPTGPIVQENLGEITPARTYQNLLQDPFDEKLMEYYLVSQLTAVDLNGNTTNINTPALYKTAAYSPDGNYLMVETINRPYSYLVPIFFFAYQTSILKPDGKIVKQLYDSPLKDDLPMGFDVAATGPRSYQWRSDKPATIVWAEALDNGDPKVKVDFRDALYSLNAPFDGDPKKLFEMEFRFRNVNWINSDYAIVNEVWRKDRKTKMTLINPDSGAFVKVISQRSSEDTYIDPGRFVYGSGPFAEDVVLTDKGKTPIVFTVGIGASPQGDRPFLMKWDLLKNKQDTLFKSKAPYYEFPVFFNNKQNVYISRESSEKAPNYFLVNIKNRKDKALTNFPDPYPSLKGVDKKLLSYPRKDGLKLSGMLYVPKDFKAGDKPLPLLVWAYPREYKTMAAAGQVKGSPYRFTRLAFRSPVYWVTRGYAVLDNADMPVVGEGDKQPNDTFLEQIEDNAIALIDYLVDTGVVDRNRIGIGGHSYGAFMVANLLAHTDLFAAGIARSGAYNRTLTPFGFQAEPRTFWQAPEVYSKMSPFNYADKIKIPLLITHGMDDENSGTFPVQSERLYSAIKGHGGTVRLVLLPKEFHGYRSREAVLHTFWEQDQWLEKYVKNRADKK